MDSSGSREAATDPDPGGLGSALDCYWVTDLQT